jgi:hypothetical protein
MLTILQAKDHARGRKLIPTNGVLVDDAYVLFHVAFGSALGDRQHQGVLNFAEVAVTHANGLTMRIALEKNV